jgi:hypothetical protein
MFVTTGSPNAPGFEPWMPATSDDVNAKQLGSEGLAPIGACTPSFWGAEAQYDYQIFDI